MGDMFVDCSLRINLKYNISALINCGAGEDDQVCMSEGTALIPNSKISTPGVLKLRQGG